MNKLIKLSASVIFLIQFSSHIECKPLEVYSSFLFNELDSTKTEIFSFPNPDEIMTYIMDETFSFNEYILSNPEETYRYYNDEEQNILVGLYLADLAYCFWLDQPAKGMIYYDAIDNLSNTQSLFPHLSFDIRDRLISNNGSIDSLKFISNDIYKLTKDYLLETERYHTYAYITMGSILESLYLTLNSTDLKYASSSIHHRIIEQQNLINNLENMLNTYLSESESSEIKKNLKPLLIAYKNMVIKKGKTTISNQNDLLIIGSDQITNPDLESIFKFKSTVEEIRNNWLKQ
nr:hypothetical protein [uncultured Carboxylicivirga sp.]